MAVDNSSLNYTEIDKFISWISSNLAGIIANDNVNSYDVSGDSPREIIKEALLAAEGEVDGYLRIRGYEIPIDQDKYPNSVNVIRMYCYNLAVYELYGRRGITKDRYYKYTRAIENLEKFSTGEKQLPDDIPVPGTKIVHGNSSTSVFSESKSYHKNTI